VSKHVSCHAHCPKPSHGPGIGLIIAIVGLVAAGAAVRAAAPAIESAARTALHVLEIAAIAVASAAGLAGLGWLAHRRHERRSAEAACAFLRAAELATEAHHDLAAGAVPLALEAPARWAHELSGLGEVPQPAPATIKE
jgi:hypothetical protein